MKLLDLPQRLRERRMFGVFDDFEWFLSPHLWTSFATGTGGASVALASGAGSGAQRAIGNAVVGGMVTATALAIFFVPLLFVLVESGVQRLKRD